MKKVIACVLMVLYFSVIAGSIANSPALANYCCETVGDFASESSAADEELGNACSDVHYTLIKASKLVRVAATVKVPRANATFLAFTNVFRQNTNYKGTFTSIAPSSNHASLFVKNCVLRV